MHQLKLIVMKVNEDRNIIFNNDVPEAPQSDVKDL